MNNIVITGVTGFVGSNLVKYFLKKNYKLHVIVRETSNLNNIKDILDDIEVFTYDNNITNLIDYFNQIKPSAVIHLASNFIAEHESNQIDSLVHSNISFGLHLLEAMKSAGIKKMINTGTSWQHFNNDDYNPVCLYAATKQAFESLISYYVEAENLQVITLKLFDTYGETDTRPKLINLLNKFADEKIELNMSPGEQVLNLIHINDVCKAYEIAYNLILQDEGIKHKSYSISSEEQFSLKEVILLFEKFTNKKINVIWGGKKYRKREVMEIWSKGKKLPNWKPEISLVEGLKRYIKS